jgi:protease I
MPKPGAPHAPLKDMPNFNELRIAVLAGDGFEETELTEPVQVLKQIGAQVEIISPLPERPLSRQGRIQGFQHFEKSISAPVDRYLNDPFVIVDNYDALVLPGGALNADQLRTNQAVLKLVNEFQSTEKPIAAICHAPWILISAGIVRGRHLTDDVKNAGGLWSDQAVVVDDNWITSRKTTDLPDLNRELIEILGRPAPLMSDDVRRAAARARIA